MIDDHAKIKLGEFEIPLIGVLPDATLETCDLCGEIIALQNAVVTDKQVLCKKCYEG